MRAIRAWCARLRGVFVSALADEMESHVQLHIDDHVRAGLSADEARRRALMSLGGLEQTRDAYRDRRGLPILESWLRDLRHGLRTLRKSPGFALAGVVIPASVSAPMRRSSRWSTPSSSARRRSARIRPGEIARGAVESTARTFVDCEITAARELQVQLALARGFLE